MQSLGRQPLGNALSLLFVGPVMSFLCGSSLRYPTRIPHIRFIKYHDITASGANLHVTVLFQVEFESLLVQSPPTTQCLGTVRPKQCIYVSRQFGPADIQPHAVDEVQECKPGLGSDIRQQAHWTQRGSETFVAIGRACP